jgi:GDP-L-fucose synthase
LGFVLSECYRKQYGIKTINLILPNAYGPFDYTDELKIHAMNGIILRMLRSIKCLDKVFTIWGSGTPIREWIYMEDATKLIKQIVDNNMYNIPNPLNLAQQFGVSINESVSTIRTLLDSKIELYHDLSKPDGAKVKILGNKLFRHYFPDFQFTDYQIGIKNTIEYYKTKI